MTNIFRNEFALLFGCQVMSNFLWPHGLQHARLLCPSPSPKVCPSSCPLHQWCHPAISSFDTHFFCPSIFPSIRDFSNKSAFRIRWPKYWSFSFSISPSKSIQDWYPLGWTGWISLQSKGLSRVFSNSLKVSILVLSQLSYLYMTTGKNHSFD